MVKRSRTLDAQTVGDCSTKSCSGLKKRKNANANKVETGTKTVVGREMTVNVPDRDSLLEEVLSLNDNNYFADVCQLLYHKISDRPVWQYFVQPVVSGNDTYCVNWGIADQMPSFADPRFHHFLDHVLKSGIFGEYNDGILVDLTAEEATDHIRQVLCAYKDFVEHPVSRL